MSMLANFFDIRKDSKELFAGLEIADNTTLCNQWMNQYPTIFLSLRQVDGLDFSGAYDMLTFIISELYKEHLYLLDSSQVNDYDKRIIEQIAAGTASIREIKGSLILLTRAMQKHYKKPVILLIDEYDVPAAKANAHGYYAEIQEIFKTTVMSWFNESAKNWNRKQLFDAVWNGDSETLTQEMNKLLRKTISYHDYKEDFYHAFLAGIFTGVGYIVESNKEHGEGRSDLVVYDSLNGLVAIFEAKYSRTLENMNSRCDTALSQIDDRMYSREFEDDYDHILCYGIAFFKKRCLVKKK